MFIETGIPKKSGAPEERNIWLSTLRSSGAERVSRYMSYKHLAALRLGRNSWLEPYRHHTRENDHCARCSS
jgi:hypothetical protein